MTTFREGDEIIVNCDNRTVPGKIVMISDNQVSVMLSFDATLKGHAGLMPAMRHDKERGVYRSIIDGAEVTFKKK
jgi:hypothetical protein